MEIKTKRQGTRDHICTQQLPIILIGIDVLSVLLVQRNARPLELQRCHPPHMSRFVLHMSAGVLVRIYDYYVCPEVSVLLMVVPFLPTTYSE
jgi:hypothetical protein